MTQSWPAFSGSTLSPAIALATCSWSSFVSVMFFSTEYAGEPLSAVAQWLQLLVAADVVYLVAGLLTFDALLEG